MTPPAVRSATARDAAAVAAIYNAGIDGREATFETRHRTPGEIEGWLEGALPFLVADRDGEVVGFARISPYSDRPAYAGVGEHGVYVAVAARGQGAGGALLAALVGAAEARGLHKLTAKLFATNAASRALHRAAGFTKVGVLRRHGRLDGEWRDCVLVERLLGEAVET